MSLSDLFDKVKNMFNSSADSGSKLKDMLGATEKRKDVKTQKAESQAGGPMPSNPQASLPAASDVWGMRFLATCLGDKKYRFCILCALLIFLLVLPIKLGPFHDGKGPNAKFPVMGQIEELCARENNRLLAQSAKAYLATKLITKSIAIVKDMQLSLGPMNFTPGSFLAGSLDAIDRVANGLFVVMTVMGVEKCLLGIISWLCFKILFPIAIILRIIYDWRPYIMARAMSVFIFRISILILIFFPVLSYFSYKIDSSFKEETNTILSEVQATDQQLGIDTFFGDNKSDLSKDDDGKAHGMLQALREKASHTMNMLSLENMKTKMTAFSDALQDKTDRLFNIFTAFALSVFIIPLFIIAVFVKILQIISSQMQAAYRQVQQESKKMLEE